MLRRAAQALAAKAAAKRELQARFGLAQDPAADVMVFMGRITHQKGCDIIAEVGRRPVSCHHTTRTVRAGVIAAVRTHAGRSRECAHARQGLQEWRRRADVS